MYTFFLTSLQVLNELLTAGIAITAFSLLLYALSFNLRDRVARSFAIILLCVVVVFVGDSLSSVASTGQEMAFWLRLQWLGIVFLPAAYLQLSDALLATTGRPSRGRRRFAVRMAYLISLAFLATLPFSLLVGLLVQNVQPAPHLQRTWLTWVFTLYYVALMVLAWVNFWRAYQRTVASSSRRRMGYLLAGALAPALGSYPYLLFGSGLAVRFPLLFWIVVILSNLAVLVLLVLMAYAVAFFGVSWPDRVVKRRLFKWVMRGPVTASIVLAITTLIRRTGEMYGLAYSALVPVIMVASILILEHLFTLGSPYLGRWLFQGKDRADIGLVESLENRLLTQSDLYQFLEAILAAICDRLQVTQAFVASLMGSELEMIVSIGGDNPFTTNTVQSSDNLHAVPFTAVDLLYNVGHNGSSSDRFVWGEYWLTPLHDPESQSPDLLGLIGVRRQPGQILDDEQSEALAILSERAALALRDRRRQQQVFSSLEALTSQVDYIQRLRAATRYESSEALAEVLTTQEVSFEDMQLSQLVKDALAHYWGGPKLTQSPLMGLKIVQQSLDAHEDNPTNALRSILRQAIDQVRPEGERRFTAEWILYNILEMKFMEGRKVREIAARLAMSEADLYRKQRVAIEAVANAIVEMEQQARREIEFEMEKGGLNGDQTTLS